MQPDHRPLTLNCLDAMLQVEQAAHPYPWSRQLLAGCFSERYFPGSLWQGQILLGYYIADQVLDESTLMNICVSPGWQGQGVGRQLMKHYLRRCEQRGITHLWLEVRASNTRAQALYRSCGYVESGRRRQYYEAGDGREDAVMMQKLL